MSTYITAIGTAVPEYKINQQEAAGWMASAMQMNDRGKKVLNSLYEASGIETRYSVLADYLKPKGEYEFYPNTDDLEPFPSTGMRMQLYKEKALPLAAGAARTCLQKRPDVKTQDISHLIVVSCTGMYAPGLDIDLVENLGLNPRVERTAIQFMGCYAAFNALKAADNICRAWPEAKVLVVCVELCTIHFQKTRDRDQLVSNAIFGDGAAALLVEAQAAKGVSLGIASFCCALETGGKRDMAWHITDSGFAMTLSSYVPQFIKGGIKDLATQLLDNMQLKLPQVDYFAIHPGGRRILEVCEEELGLSPEDNCFAYEILMQYGNMSSPTVIFVIDNIMKNLKEWDKDKKLLSFAFGPGLTMESMLLNINYA